MNWFNKIMSKGQQDPVMGAALRPTSEDGIFKAYIPNFLYKPPYGMPRMVNTAQLKALSKNAYVFSIIKTLADESTSLGWDIKIKEEFNNPEDNNEDGKLVDDEDDEKKVDEKAIVSQYEEKIKEVTKFFRNPNGNEESFNNILRTVITDICEVDAGLIVKVFNVAGQMTQIFARDGATFLKNPNIYGYMGDREEFVAPLPVNNQTVPIDFGGTPAPAHKQFMKQYDYLFRDNAAYFQYGWTAGSMPVPFGKREVVYIMQNPRSDTIYGRSPIEVLSEIILNLIYGADFNLDFYTNNNMPEGVIQLMGAQQPQIEQFRQNFEAQFKHTDSLGNKRKKFFTFPITTTEVQFTSFQLNAQEMQVLEQQKWFIKLLWMCFGVTADEMGFTEDSKGMGNTVGESQIKIFKRKAIKPILNAIQYHINTEIMPEFFTKGTDLPDFADIPLEFVFDTYDIDEDIKQHSLYKQQMDLGIKTSEMIAEEAGIDVEKLKKSKEAQAELDMAKFEKEASFGGQQNGNNFEGNNNNPKKDKFNDPKAAKKLKKEKKKSVGKSQSKALSPLKEVTNYIDGIEDALIEAIDDIDENAQ